MGTAERKKRELEKRKQLILDKSRELFFRKGYDNVSVEEICRAAEYGRSALYSLFQSKEELYANICLQGLNILSGMMADLESARDLEEALIQATLILNDFYDQHQSFYKALFYFSTHTYDRTRIRPELRKAVEAAEVKALSPLGAVLSRAVESGQARPMPVDRAVWVFWSGLMGVVSSFICKGMADQSLLLREYCLVYADIYLQGILKPV